MGPFSRTKTAQATHGARSTDWEVRAPEFRRVGHAMATVVVALRKSEPGASLSGGARLTARSHAGTVVIDASLITCQAPGTPDELHRVWFQTDLSRLIFGDGEFALEIDGTEIPLEYPIPRPTWDTDGDEDAPVSAAWSESELQAAVRSLEERCRVAERSATELRDLLANKVRDGEYATKLVNAWREVEVLQELLDSREVAYRAVKEVLDAAASDRDARDAQVQVLQEQLERARREAEQRDAALTREIEEARERAADGRRMAEVVASTLAQVQREREELLSREARTIAELDQERAEREARLAEANESLAEMGRKFEAIAQRRPRRRGLLGMLGAPGPSDRAGRPNS